MVMMSRKGLLLEADFYHPVQPLAICTPEVIEGADRPSVRHPARRGLCVV